MFTLWALPIRGRRDGSRHSSEVSTFMTISISVSIPKRNGKNQERKMF